MTRVKSCLLFLSQVKVLSFCHRWRQMGKTVKALTHEQFWSYVWGGPFKLHAVSPICLKCTGCHTMQPKLTGWSKGKVNIFNLATVQWLPSLVTSGLSFTSVQMTVTDWLADAVRSFGMQHAVFGMGRLKPELWVVSTVQLLTVSLFCHSMCKLCWHMIHLRSGLDGPHLYSQRDSCMHTFSQINHVGRS